MDHHRSRPSGNSTEFRIGASLACNVGGWARADPFFQCCILVPGPFLQRAPRGAGVSGYALDSKVPACRPCSGRQPPSQPATLLVSTRIEMSKRGHGAGALPLTCLSPSPLPPPIPAPMLPLIILLVLLCAAHRHQKKRPGLARSQDSDWLIREPARDQQKSYNEC